MRDVADGEGLIPGCGPVVGVSATEPSSLRQQIFECVRAAGQIARIDVARQVAVSPATVTTAVQDLIAAGLLHEIETRPRDERRGRPPVALAVPATAGAVVGIKLSDNEHTAVVLDLAGQIRGEAIRPTDTMHQSSRALVDAAAAVLKAALENAGITQAAVLHVGIGLPGSVAYETGHVFWSPLLSDVSIDLRAELSDALGLPVTIDNDANILTLAELWFGAGRSMPNFAVVTIEQGVGMGMVINHALYRGARGLAMELGHIKVQLDGALCRCGQRGCLEAYLADYALVREASTALNWTPPAGATGSILLEALFDEAKAGNEAARSIFRRAGRYLSVALANVTNLFDPALIILSGDRMRFDYLYAEAMVSEMSNMSMGPLKSGPRVEVNAWDGLVWARGAGALALAEATPGLVANAMVRL